jgi:hypothetical protein
LPTALPSETENIPGEGRGSNLTCPVFSSEDYDHPNHEVAESGEYFL